MIEGVKYGTAVALLPLYTRIRREEVLDQFVRGKVLGYVIANPGDHYNAIMRRLRLHNGTFAYHVHTLEREGYIRSSKDGRFRRFYPADAPATSQPALETEDKVLEAIRRNPGTTKQQVADLLGVSRATVAYHVRVLEIAGLVQSEVKDRVAYHWGIAPELPPEGQGAEEE